MLEPMKLSQLAQKNHTAPPSLSALIRLGQSSTLQDWLEAVIAHYLPGEEHILNAGPGDQETLLTGFAAAWEKHQFALSPSYINWMLDDDYFYSEDEPQTPMESIKEEGLPYQVFGLDGRDFNLDSLAEAYSEGVLLMALLTGLQENVYHTEDPEQRRKWEEQALILMGPKGLTRATLDRIPQGGINHSLIKKHLTDTDLAFLIPLALWCNNDTGLLLADETVCEECGPGGHKCPWDHEMIEGLAEDFRRTAQLLQESNGASARLSSSPREILNDVLDRILPELEDKNQHERDRPD